MLFLRINVLSEQAMRAAAAGARCYRYEHAYSGQATSEATTRWRSASACSGWATARARRRPAAKREWPAGSDAYPKASD